GEDLVIEIGTEEAALRMGQLEPHQQRQGPAEQEKEKGGDDEAFADRPMVHIAKPAEHSPRIMPSPLQHLTLALLRNHARRWAAGLGHRRLRAHCKLSR